MNDDRDARREAWRAQLRARYRAMKGEADDKRGKFWNNMSNLSWNRPVAKPRKTRRRII